MERGRAPLQAPTMKELFTVLAPRDALDRLLGYISPRTKVEYVATCDALDRVLADDIEAPESLPAFPRSTMDGFAVRAADTFGASEGLPAYLTIAGEVLMGHAADVRLQSGQCARIAT